MALVLLQLGLEAFEQREGIGRGANETGQHWSRYNLRTLRAAFLTTTLPSVTYPSPPMATCTPCGVSRRTQTMVAP